MLGWGNNVWVSFVFCMPAYYCFKNPQKDIPLWAAAATVGVYYFGYLIFGQSNTQKDQFRREPKEKIWGKEPKTLRTSNGKNLLLSGWWGVGRHMNYTGDLLMAYSFGLPCVYIGLVPFIYAGYLTVLLVHRERRDDGFCQQKYGKDWNEYCKLVPYRMVPYVY